MTTQPVVDGVVPQWTRGDFLRKARTHAGLTVKQLSDATGISEKTINNYEGDRYVPRRAYLITWALATGVSLEWLEHGHLTPPDGDPTGLSGDASALSDTCRYLATRLTAVAA